MRFARPVRIGLASTFGRTGVLRPGRFWKGKAAVFTFHRIEGSTDDGSVLSSTESIAEPLFESFCQIIANEFSPLSLTEFCECLTDRHSFPQRACLITFDDGWYDNYLFGLPILKRYNLPATIFIPTAFIGTEKHFWQDEIFATFHHLHRRRREGRIALAPEVIGDVIFDMLEKPGDRVWFYSREAIERLKNYSAETRHKVLSELSRWVRGNGDGGSGMRAFINWEEACEMKSAGVTFGSHTVRHLPLTQIAGSILKAELEDSREHLLHRLGIETLALAYPNGLHDSEVRLATRQAGYVAGFTTDHGVVSIDDDPLALSRIDVTTEAISRDGASVDRALMALECTPVVLDLRRRRHDPNRPEAGMRPHVKRPIKLLFLINHMLSEGGTERQLVQLLRGLDPGRYQTYLACFSISDWLKSLELPATIVDLKIHSLKSPILPLRLARFVRFLRREKIEIIHTFFADASLVGLITGKLAGVTRRISSRRNFVDLFMTVQQRLAKPLSHRIAVNSFSVKKRTIELEGVNSRKIDVIYNGVAFENFASLDDPHHTERLRLRRELGIPTDAPVVGIVANLRPVKGLQYFVAAAKDVLERHPSTHFAIVGSGGLLEQLTRQAREAGVQDHVHFCGRTANVIPYLAMFDVAVLSSLSEGFSNAILEYMAAGLPVVATDVGSNWEAVIHGETGYIVPSENPEEIAIAVSRLLDDPERARTMGLAGRKRVNSYFGIQRMVGEYDRYYEDLLRTNFPRPKFRV